jgi:hypothetical protein
LRRPSLLTSLKCTLAYTATNKLKSVAWAGCRRYPKSTQEPRAYSIEAAIFRRKWQAGIVPGRTLPPYEDIVLGSLGRLTDRLIVVEGQSPQTFKVLRCRRGIHDWLGADAEHKPIGRLPKEFLGPLCATLERALIIIAQSPNASMPAGCSGGMVETFELLVLSLWRRWGSTLLVVHIAEVGTPVQFRG